MAPRSALVGYRRSRERLAEALKASPGCAWPRLTPMASIPLKPQYGPTRGQLLSPRWRASSRPLRGLVVILLCGLVVLAIAAALTLQRASYSHGGRLPFHFEYRGLYRTVPPPGVYVDVQRRLPSGQLEDSFAVSPLLLPAYQGSLSGELPLYAAGYIRGLAARYRDFDLQGEGKTRISTVPGYTIFYTARVGGREMYGRDVLLLPETPGVRRGVDIVMLTAPHANAQVKSALEVASEGVLNTALHTFEFG
jgi:hypothetical protein